MDNIDQITNVIDKPMEQYKKLKAIRIVLFHPFGSKEHFNHDWDNMNDFIAANLQKLKDDKDNSNVIRNGNAIHYTKTVEVVSEDSLWGNKVNWIVVFEEIY